MAREQKSEMCVCVCHIYANQTTRLAMAKYAKVPAAKLENMSSILGSHMVEEKNLLPLRLSPTSMWV